MNQKKKYVTGIVDMTSTGNGYIMSPDYDQDIFVSASRLNTALDQDRVKVLLYARRKSKKPRGEVVEVLERHRTEFVGVIKLSSTFAFLVTDDPNMPFDIYIPGQDFGKVKAGDKAVARIVEWPKGAKNPVGELTEILGRPGDNNVEMRSIIVEAGFPLHFPDDVMQEVNRLPRKIPDKAYASRKDLRKVPTFTIDPSDAKDFDDALSLRRLSNGHWEVGVHIADVSHYVSPDSALDKEAYKRATSVYLVDRVIPMFPEVLSNIICSLRPEEDKLCMSALFELDEQAVVQREWFGPTVIRSDKRFEYEEAQEVIEQGRGPMSKELKQLNKFAGILRKKRFSEGSIAFETVEVKFKIDLDGVPLGIYLKERKDAHLLVEDFMLLANLRVARFMAGDKQDKSKKKRDNVHFVYRIHDYPDMEKIANFTRFAKRFGYKLNIQKEQDIAPAMNRLMTEVQGKPEQNILEQMAIRTMAKAVYTTENIGHYGLGFKHYTHFTSPIRRYPDVMVHRLLKAQLSHKPLRPAHLEDQCEHVSQMERNALSAERASIKYKQVEFLEQHKGQPFEGIISGLMEWGFFVELMENKCEGAVRLKDLMDDYYVLDEENFCLLGRDTGNTYALGDKVEVAITHTDLSRRIVDFKLVQ